MDKKKKPSKANKKPTKVSKKEPQAIIKDVNHSAIYIKNEKTGEWQVKNPAGSMGYNYLYRDDNSE